MAVEWASKRIVYFPVPKNACTSLKHVFWRLNNSGQTPSFALEGGIHEMYAGTPSFHLNNISAYRTWKRVAVVRDPVDRFLSCYVNRVVDIRQLDATHIQKAAQFFGVPCNPDIHTFIDKLDVYRALSPTIAHHFNPQTYFLGSDLGAYSHVYDIRDLAELAEFLERSGDEEIVLPHIMGSSSKVDKHELSAREIATIRDLYAGDYAMLRSGVKRPKRGTPSGEPRQRQPIDFIGLLQDGEIDVAQQRRLGSNVVVYVGPGLQRGSVRKGPRALRISVEFDGQSVIALELHDEKRIPFGQSYSVDLTVKSKTAVVMSLFCRLDDLASGEQLYLGTSKFQIVPGVSESRVILDTEHIPKSVSGRDDTDTKISKFILLVDKADKADLSITKFKLSPVDV